MILNLTPHPIRLYSNEREDGIDDLEPHLRHAIEPEPVPARLATFEVSSGMWPELVEFGHAQNLPPKRDGYQYIVSLVVALVYQRFVLRRDTAGALTERNPE